MKKVYIDLTEENINLITNRAKDLDQMKNKENPDSKRRKMLVNLLNFNLRLLKDVKVVW